MPVMADLRNGTRVRVSAPELGAVVGEIVDIRAPGDLPEISEDPELGAHTRDLLRTWGVTRVAMIAYNYGGQMVIFVAMEVNDNWYDLQRRRLAIEIVGQVERPQRHVQ